MIVRMLMNVRPSSMLDLLFGFLSATVATCHPRIENGFMTGDVLCVEPGSEVSEQSSFRVGHSNGIESSKLISVAIDFNLEQGYGDLRVTVEIKLN